MKRIFCIAACAIVALASCTPDQSGQEGPVIVDKDDVLVDKDDVLDGETQKLKLEQVGNKLMSVFAAKEYKDLLKTTAALCYHADEYYDDNEYDWSELAEAGDDIWEKLYSEEKKSEYRWEYTYTLFLSNCTGVLTLGKEVADFKKSASERKVILEDIEGENWEIVVTPEGLQQVHLGEWLETYTDYYDTDYEELYDVTVEVPSSLALKITKGGEYLADVNVTFDYSISKGGFDYAKDRLGVGLEVKVDDLTLKLEKCAYDAATDEFVCSQTLHKGEMMVCSAEVSSKLPLDVEEKGEDAEVDGDVEVLNAKVNILGEIQIEGTLTELKKLMELTDDEYKTESACEKAAEEALTYAKLNVYYDCTSTVQAVVEFEPYYYEEYDYSDYDENTYEPKKVHCFYLEPVIVFEDGSRYFFYEYFKERYFKDLIENFEDFLNGYEFIYDGLY